MLNMIKLDWSAMKYYHVRVLILLPYLLYVGWFSPISVIPLAVILMFAYSVNPFAVEEKGDLNRLYLSLPVKRSSIVAGRYCLSLLMFLAGLAAGLVIMPLGNLISPSKWYPGLLGYMAIIAFSFLIHSIMSLAMYPLLFWLGYQKGKFWGFYVPGILVALLYVALMTCNRFFYKGMMVTDMLTYALEHMFLICGGMLVLGLMVLGLSFYLSLRAYCGREF